MKPTLYTLTGIIIAYLFTSFIPLEPNALLWSNKYRAIFLLMAFCFGFLGWIIGSDIDEPED